jgi:hypothetical protein
MTEAVKYIRLPFLLFIFDNFQSYFVIVRLTLSVNLRPTFHGCLRWALGRVTVRRDKRWHGGTDLSNRTFRPL